MKLEDRQRHLSMYKNGMGHQLCSQSHHLDFFATIPVPQNNGENTPKQQKIGHLKEMR